MITAAAAVVLGTTSVLLFMFGANLLYLTVRALRLRPVPARRRVEDGEPLVCVQIPVYDERYVAERVLDAVCRIDWPRDRLEIQVLDDSDDDTIGIVGRHVAAWQRRGIAMAHIRRGTRIDFKAGALAHGLLQTRADFIAIFDADFVPPADFLRRTIGAFDDDAVGFVQARWGHLDEDYSLFTRLQAMAIDFHFLVEQAVRSRSGFFTNFTGTAGVWRRAAIEDAGGWSARTLTEDLDLSYRAQLRGWKAAYIEELVVPEELPVSIDAYRRQQSRWATGSFQSAFKLLGPVMQSDARAMVKFQAAVHLLAYGVGPVMLVQLACYPFLLLTHDGIGIRLPWYVSIASAVSIVVGAMPWVGFIAAQLRRGRGVWAGVPSLLCQVVGAALSLNTLLALVRAVRPGGVFIRTPKHHIVHAGQEWRDQAYVRVGDPRTLLEGVVGIAAVALVPVALSLREYMVAVYAGMFAVGFLAVTMLSLIELVDVLARRGGLARLWRLAPEVGLVAGVTVVLLAASRLAEPFEDGYGHWLIAAHLASTGHLQDPLFNMEDTWLPGYHVFAAGVLKVFGLWQLGLLKAAGAVFGVVTAACVYAFAPNARQARVAVTLLVLNPVFLFTSGTAVVEPLVTTLLMAGSLAAYRNRMKIAATLAAMACLTSTKAWIWVAVAASLAVVLAVRSRAGTQARARAVAWAVPALGVLVFLQLAFAPATHSMARGSLEVMSATARGSIAGSAVDRLLELTRTFGLAALPLFVLAIPGVVAATRRYATRAWAFLYVPALVYLAVVFALVAAGTYTGSHRYLYPALPALALLVAAALDRQAWPARVAAAGATAALAVAFLPVFWSFGDQDRGLIAAGRASASSPGMLLTDSPVAAYYSGKAPTLITGSAALPPDRAQAVRWLHDHDVASLVVEDISYYRATEVFPDLVSGSSTLPFVPLGAQVSYQAPGGKPVHAYRLLPDLNLDSTAKGKTAPLAKGMTMGAAATGEGMGFGVPIVRYSDGWVYSRTSSTVQTSPTSWTRTFQLDEIGGDAARRYQFQSIPSRGAIEVTYALDATGVAINVRVVSLAPGWSEIAILNEQSAAFDDLAADGQPAISLGNWVPVSGAWARLRSPSVGIEWSVPSLDGAQLFAGRELAGPDFDWAGLDYVFGPTFAGAGYHINIQEAQ